MKERSSSFHTDVVITNVIMMFYSNAENFLGIYEWVLLFYMFIRINHFLKVRNSHVYSDVVLGCI